MRSTYITFTLLAVFTAYSCNMGEESRAPQTDIVQEQTITDKLQDPDAGRKIVKEGKITFETDDIRDTKEFVTSVADRLGGYIAGDNLYDRRNRVTQQLTIRVPAGNFDQLLAEIVQRAGEADSKNITVHDITEEYIDIEARIEVKKDIERRYRELLERAVTIEDILNIEKEIGALRAEIESVEGRLRYLKDQVSFSTLTVEYYEKKSFASGYPARIAQAIKQGWDLLLMLIIGLIHLWPLFIIILIVAVVRRRHIRAKQTDYSGQPEQHKK